MNNFIVVIRSIGERTELLCKKLILDQGIDSKDLKIIHEVPFIAALKKSYEMGIESGKKWTLCVDADILLRRNSVKQVINFAEKEPDTTCEVQGFIFDKFFGGIRQGGIHLYRSSLLPTILKQLPNSNESIRPETETLRKMRNLGYSRSIISYVVGTHDDQQYFKDIYRKAFVHAIKHREKLPLFVNLWNQNKENDRDFEVALKALSDSIDYSKKVYIDVNLSVYNENFFKYNLIEKSNLDPKRINLEDVDSIINNWNPSSIYLKYYPNSDGFDNNLSAGIRNMRRLVNKNKKSFSLRHLLGSALIKAGRRIKP